MKGMKSKQQGFFSIAVAAVVLALGAAAGTGLSIDSTPSEDQTAQVEQKMSAPMYTTQRSDLEQ